MWEIYYFCLLFLISIVTSKLFDCPVEWETNGGYCYRFVAYPRLIYEQANQNCKDDGAILLSVNSEDEHRFVTNWLDQNDQRRDQWYTSGVISTSVAGGIQWEGDNSFSQTLNFWLNDTDASKDGMTLVYKHSGTEYGWGVAPKATVLSFICEISQLEAYRIVEETRDFGYGLDIDNLNMIPHGPKFIIEPENTVILGKTTAVYLDCIAEGVPHPQYTWYNVSKAGKKSITPTARYTLTNGRLSISNPDSRDENDYQCIAENEHGKSLSSQVQLSFGYLEEFNNNPQNDVYASEHDGAQLKCPSVNYKPAIKYQWYKNTVKSFVRPSLQKYIFISNNGKLYFSEVTKGDSASYHCLVTLTNRGGASKGNYIGASQPPSRASLGFRLIVTSGAAKKNQPQIQDDFISVYPGNPQKGQTLLMECFAYGTGPLLYEWSRIGRGMPKGVTYRDKKRMLVIPDVAMEDQGVYNCRVASSSTGLSDSRNYSLRIEAKPYFTFPLKDQHADNKARLTWYCEAGGVPIPTYSWYKNGEPLYSQSSVNVNSNILKIESLDKSHQGMYQCAATNKYGTVFSTAQLRVLEFKPSFKKFPLEKMVTAAQGGNITFVCNPEAAPSPTYSWLKDGRNLGLTKGSVSGNMRMLLNGNLYIENVGYGDQGRYTCSVENVAGKAEDSGYINVVEKIQITRSPSAERVIINSTATMICEGSHNPNMDMVYSWFFNNYQIHFEENPHYRMGGGITAGYLYILNAQFIHAGNYKCQVSTALDHTSASAYLTVLGPPGQPVGLFRDSNPGAENMGPRMVTLLWSDGLTHGAVMQYYVIEFKTTFNLEWRVLVNKLYVSDSLSQQYPSKRTYTLKNLKPGATYIFRVRAMNRYGIGHFSNPTPAINVESDIPQKPPAVVGGGGGKVGDLTIKWTPLPREDLNGENLGYQVHWRTKPKFNSDSKWEQARVSGSYRSEFVTTVGDEVYYTDYQVKVQAFNSKGMGKISDVVDIKSAEDLPYGTPTKVYSDSFNSTSLIVFWDPVIDDRLNMKGKLLGYKINYWRKDVDIEQGATQNILSGQIDQGLIIGLEPDTWYTVNVQVFNGAGNGPKSEVFHQSTDRTAPQLYPTEIYVHSYGVNSVRVTFRGVSTQNIEEPLQGYKIKYWRSGENIRKALHLDCEKNNYGVIRDIEPDIVYQLRIFGYSQGGQGKMSSPATYFTFGGLVRLDPTTTEILAGSSSLTPYVMFILLSSLLTLLYNRS